MKQFIFVTILATLALLALRPAPQMQAQSRGFNVAQPTAVVVSSCGGKSLTAGNNSVVYIDTTGQLCVGATLSTGALATSANQTTLNTAIGAQADAACGTDTGTCSLIALIKKQTSDITTATGVTTAASANSTVRAYQTLVSGGTASMTGTTSTQVIAAAASNNIYVTSCSVNNTHASVDTLVDLQDGMGGTVIWTFAAAHGYGGESHDFGDDPLKVPTTGNGLYAVDETTGAAVKVFCNGFKSTTSY